MKIATFVLSLLLISSCSLYGQDYEETIGPVEVIEQQVIMLESRSKIGGIDRNHVVVNLPPNTLYWYYSIGANKDKSAERTMKLIDQFAKGASNFDFGVSSGILLAGQLVAPTSTAHVDVYLTRANGHQTFMQQDDLGMWLYKDKMPYTLSEGTRTNFVGGIETMQKEIAGQYYINLKNSNVIGAIYVSVEVVAVVKTRKYIDKWVNLGTREVESDCRNTFLLRDGSVDAVCKCVSEEVVPEYKPSEYFNLAETQKKDLHKRKKRICFEKTGNSELAAKEERLRELIKEINAAEAIKDYNLLSTKYTELIDAGVHSANIYNSAGWNSILAQKFDLAKGYLSRGIALEADNLFLQGNLAHAFILTNQYTNAEEIYKRYKGKKLAKGVTWKKMVAEDYDLFESIGIRHADFDRIRKLLNIRPGKNSTSAPTVSAPGSLKVGNKVVFKKGRDIVIANIELVNHYKEKATISYLNIYGEKETLDKKLEQLSPITEEQYKERLATHMIEVEKYKYSIGEYAIWGKNDTKFGEIQRLDDRSHRATISYLDIFGDTKSLKVPYLDIKIIKEEGYAKRVQEWQGEMNKYVFEVDETVSWIKNELVPFSKELEEGQIVSLDDKKHQATIKYINAKGEEKVIKKNYLKLIKKA
jgi:hypothetical protein